MDFGLFSNGERTNKVAAETYDEDLAEVVILLAIARGQLRTAKLFLQKPVLLHRLDGFRAPQNAWQVASPEIPR